jgi:CRISPR-associated protein Cas1
MAGAIGRIIDIESVGRHLTVDRGFMVVSEAQLEIGRIPLDDIAAVIVSGHGVTHSSNLLVALAQRGAPVVLCAANYTPAGVLWSVDGNYEQAGRMDAQLAASKPLNKRLWQSVVATKLTMQAAVLEAAGKPHIPLSALARQVRSGDPENIEAQGARRYWTLLFGDDFRRDRDASGTNSLLNYGYAVLRASVARGILGAGLHPTISMHHSNQQNTLRLADDLMEPFRPLVDARVYGLVQLGRHAIDKFTKRHLVGAMYGDLPTEVGLLPMMACINRLCTSLAMVYKGDEKALSLFKPPSPMELKSWIEPDLNG